MGLASLIAPGLSYNGNDNTPSSFEVMSVGFLSSHHLRLSLTLKTPYVSCFKYPF